MIRKHRTIVRLLALVAILALVGAACSSKKPVVQQPTQKVGGTFHWVTDELFWSLSGNGFDPSFEYLTTNWDIFSSLMLRTLTTYTHRPNGTTTVPDIATGPGVYTADHMSITYTLKKGIKFSPPVLREVHSQDIAFAIERVATSSLDTGGYPTYYTDFVKGLTGLKNASTYVPIPGISTPDNYTITFNFSKPNYDWDFRMAMPAAAPIPPEIGKCFPKPLDYGQYVISTGPYYIQGLDALDPSSCAAFKAKKPSGFDFSKFLNLVRNPSYDKTTDSTTIREALPDVWAISQDTNVSDCFQRVEANKIEWCDAAVTGKTIQTYQTTPALQNLIHSNDDNSTWYISMNLTEPPFDDVHVRKALNLALDKSALERLRGGPLTTTIAEHVIPPSLLSGQLAAGNFDPYATTNHAGDLTKAKAEMMQSKYDTNHDGLCDVQTPVKGESRTVCGSTSGPVVVINRATSPYKEYEPVIQKALNGIGITVRFAEGPGFYGRAGKASAHVVLGMGGGWGPDWPDPGVFLEQIMTGGAIHAQTYNLGYLGLTQTVAQQLGINYPAGGVPSIDSDYTHCSSLTGAERLTCWVDLDKKLMNDIVPWVPYRWGKATRVVSAAVTGYDFDAFATDVSLAHLGLDTTKQSAS
jgi:peptide/nickel transport system substrate-binding protein